MVQTVVCEVGGRGSSGWDVWVCSDAWFCANIECVIGVRV